MSAGLINALLPIIIDVAKDIFDDLKKNPNKKFEDASKEVVSRHFRAGDEEALNESFNDIIGRIKSRDSRMSNDDRGGGTATS